MQNTTPKTPHRPTRRFQSYSMVPFQTASSFLANSNKKITQDPTDTVQQVQGTNCMRKTTTPTMEQMGSPNQPKFKSFKKSHQIIAEIKSGRRINLQNSSVKREFDRMELSSSQNFKARVPNPSESFDSSTNSQNSLKNVSVSKTPVISKLTSLENSVHSHVQGKNTISKQIFKEKIRRFSLLQSETFHFSRTGQQQKQLLPKYVPKKFDFEARKRKNSQCLDQAGVQQKTLSLKEQSVFVPPAKEHTHKIKTTASTISSELQNYQSTRNLKDFEDFQQDHKQYPLTPMKSRLSFKRPEGTLERVEEEPQNTPLQDQVNGLFSDQQQKQEQYIQELEQEFSSIF